MADNIHHFWANVLTDLGNGIMAGRHYTSPNKLSLGPYTLSLSLNKALQYLGQTLILTPHPGQTQINIPPYTLYLSTQLSANARFQNVSLLMIPFPQSGHEKLDYWKTLKTHDLFVPAST